MHQVLRVGDYGAEITELQQYLASLGYAEMAMAAPEVFDDVTEQVVRQFQRDYGLSETGEYDEDTWRTMVALPVAAQPADSSLDGQPGVAAGPADPAASYQVPDMLQPNDLAPLEDARGVTEREFQPQGGVAVRVDPTFCVFWGFAVGSTELLADHRPLLSEIADTLLTVDPLASVDIAGHTSASGGSARNQTISEGRAARMRDALEELGVATHRIQWWGEGENRPWLPEDQDSAAMARNRRVEVVVRLVSGIDDQTPAPRDTGKTDPGKTDPTGTTGDKDPVPVKPIGGLPPRIRVRVLITDPPVDLPDSGPGIIDRIRQICDGLPDLLLDALEFDFEAGSLLIFGFALSTLASMAGVAIAALGLGEALAAAVLAAMKELEALETALRELGDLTQPSGGTGGTPPQDAGVPPPAGVPPAGGAPGDVWAMREDERGRLIENELGNTVYSGYTHTDNLDGFQRARNFPLIDFVSADGQHSVSVKTYNPFTKAYQRGDTIYDVVAHAREVGDYAPGGRVTLDIRMPPETPDDAIQDLLDTIRGEVGHPRLEVLVSRWP